MAGTSLHAGIGDRLGSTLFVAALAHGIVILGITFTTSPLPETETLPTLNVTVLLAGAEAEPSDDSADLLADRAELGAGQPLAALRPTRTLTATDPVSRVGESGGGDLEAGAPREHAPQVEQLVARSFAQAQVAATPQPTETPAAERQRPATLFATIAPPSRVAELDAIAVAPRGAETGDVASESTSESAIATYLVAWRTRVERIGTANFPARVLDAGRRFGRPTLEVAVGSDGRLQDIVVRKSSGDATLDQAALRILRMAAPFEPLPPSVAAEYPVLRFAYEWDFDIGDAAATPPAVR